MNGHFRSYLLTQRSAACPCTCQGARTSAVALNGRATPSNAKRPVSVACNFLLCRIEVVMSMRVCIFGAACVVSCIHTQRNLELFTALHPYCCSGVYSSGGKVVLRLGTFIWIEICGVHMF